MKSPALLFRTLKVLLGGKLNGIWQVYLASVWAGGLTAPDFCQNSAAFRGYGNKWKMVADHDQLPTTIAHSMPINSCSYMQQSSFFSLSLPASSHVSLASL